MAKKALCKESVKHIFRMKHMQEKWKNMLPNISCLEGKLLDHEYRIPYIEGVDIDASLYEWRNDSSQFIKCVEKVIKNYLIPDEKDMLDFSITSEYKTVFGNNYPQNGKSLKTTNVDCVCSNLRLGNDGIVYNFDYEWIFDFPIPWKYVLWRSLNQIYTKYNVYLKDKISAYDFYARFEMDKKSVQIFEKMEQRFSNYVRGDGNKEAYLINYRKTALLQNIRLV